MMQQFGSKYTDILAAIGPGIQQENYQVDVKTASYFEKEFLKPDGKDHYRLDIQGKIISQLIKTGVKNSHIEYDTRCTFENKDLFYSYRRDGQNSGRMMGLISLL
jgi:copper oxidase (laccase) domain-containing protein